MHIHYFHDYHLPEEARKLVEFDVDSLLHVIADEGGPIPKTWLADPDAYERDGRIHRDSTSPRLLAYSDECLAVYATDGCNTCSHRVPARIDTLSRIELESFAQDTQIRLEMLERLAALV